ncbi:choice-of-anchor P family protein [Amycolatopsis nigrescens]|uniref:choice-of-anchor P family protein n=1 Tax=Amycolatopsis nigrescens TaxID=381445 RepID=UPI00036448CA|nr:choice-of-anchor P family protein [Amycolatopsis nigrescens]
MSPNRVTVCGVGAVSALLATGLLLPPAAGATEHRNSAYAVAASGLVKIDPLPSVNDAKGFEQKTIAEFATPEKLVQLKKLNAQAGKGKAKASIADLEVDLGLLKGADDKPLLSATAIEAVCEDGKGSATLAKARFGEIKLDVAAAPNTGVKVPGIASVLLNKQTKNKDGSLTVTAISVSLDGIQTLDLASATCAAGEGDGGPSETKPPTSSSSKPAPSSSKGGDDGDGPSKRPPGDRPDADGKAPRPTPVKAHLDVTG